MRTEQRRGRAARWLILSLLVIMADQVSKNYIAEHFGG